MSKLIEFDKNTIYDTIVIGAGPAAISSAIYAVRKGLKTAIIGDYVGGQLLNTNDIENIIGLPLTNGFEFSNLLEKHLNEYEVAFYKGHKVEKIINKEKNKVLILDDEVEVETKTIIIATGAKWRKLNIEGEDKYSGKGVHYCATCDGPFYRNKEVIVVGGGNSGVEAAIDLSNIVSKVTLIEYLDKLNADKVLIDKLNSLDKIEVKLSSKAIEVKGNIFAESLVIENRLDGKIEEIKTDALFVEIGTVANSDLVKDLVKTNNNGEIIIDENNMTNVDGIFAAGDCSNVKFKQVIIAMGEGAKAALGVFEYLMKKY